MQFLKCIQVANKPVERFSTSCLQRNANKSTIRYHYTPVRVIKTHNEDAVCQQEWETNETSLIVVRFTLQISLVINYKTKHTPLFVSKAELHRERQ